MDFDVSVSDVQITGDLNRVIRHAGLPFMRAIRRSVEEEIERTCPYRHGHLLRSTYVELDEKTGDITAGATASYAAAVHDGHTTRNGTWVEGRPYIRAALVKYSRGKIGR